MAVMRAVTRPALGRTGRRGRGLMVFSCNGGGGCGGYSGLGAASCSSRRREGANNPYGVSRAPHHRLSQSATSLSWVSSWPRRRGRPPYPHHPGHEGQHPREGSSQRLGRSTALAVGGGARYRRRVMGVVMLAVPTDGLMSCSCPVIMARDEPQLRDFSLCRRHHVRPITMLPVLQ